MAKARISALARAPRPRPAANSSTARAVSSASASTSSRNEPVNSCSRRSQPSARSPSSAGAANLPGLFVTMPASHAPPAPPRSASQPSISASTTPSPGAKRSSAASASRGRAGRFNPAVTPSTAASGRNSTPVCLVASAQPSSSPAANHRPPAAAVSPASAHMSIRGSEKAVGAKAMANGESATNSAASGAAPLPHSRQARRAVSAMVIMLAYKPGSRALTSLPHDTEMPAARR